MARRSKQAILEDLANVNKVIKKIRIKKNEVIFSKQKKQLEEM